MTSIVSIGTGYSVDGRPRGAFTTDVSGVGTMMLSALVATKAMPRRIHMLPSVMMNGCTRSPTTSAPLSSPQRSPTPTHTANPVSTVPALLVVPMARSTSAIDTPASA